MAPPAMLLTIVAMALACTPAAIPPLTAPAPPQDRVYRVGLMVSDGPVWSAWAEALREGLSELGYVEGRNLVIVEVPSDDGDIEKTLATIRALERAQVDVLVSALLPHHVEMVSKATGSLPLVEPLLNSPNVGTESIASYAHPGGSMTGIIGIDVAQHARRLQLLKETAPNISRVIVLTPWDRPPDLPGWAEITEMASALKLEIERVQPAGPDDIEPALEAAIQRGADGLLQYQGNPFADVDVRQRVVDVAARHRIPAVYIDQGWARIGGLMAYNPNSMANYRRAAAYVDWILKGTRVGDLPVEQPARFDFIVNLVTAQSLGLVVPPTVLAQASELVQ